MTMAEQLGLAPALPATTGPWWLMGEDPEGQVWVMLGPIANFDEATNHFEHFDDAADPGWAFWLWIGRDFQRSWVMMLSAKVG